MSFIVNPLTAMMETPGLSSSVVRKPECLVSSISEMDPTNTGDIKLIAPFGVHATKNFAVLCCLYWLHVDDCMCRSDGVCKNISLPSMMA